MRFALFALLLLTTAACGSPAPLYQIEAAPAEVDGVADEWPAALRPVPSEAGLSIGLREDGDDLVVVVVAGDDRQSRRIALGGLTVWVDPTGGTDRVLGVRYPAPEDPDLEAVVRNAPRRGGPSSTDPQQLRRRFEAGLETVEVTSGVVTQRAAPDGGFAGLETAATWGPRGLVVEMRIPLDATPGLLPAPAGEAVGIGVELLDSSRAGLRRSMDAARRGAPPAAGDRPMPTPERSAIDPESVDLETVTRWLRIELD